MGLAGALIFVAPGFHYSAAGGLIKPPVRLQNARQSARIIKESTVESFGFV